MNRYDYEKALKEDALKWLKNNINPGHLKKGKEHADGNRQWLLYRLTGHTHQIVCEGVNKTLSVEEARECLRYNYDLLHEALRAQPGISLHDEKEMDRAVREYLLPEFLGDAADEFIRISVPEI